MSALETVAAVIGVVVLIFIAGVIPMVGDHVRHRISEHFRLKRAMRHQHQWEVTMGPNGFVGRCACGLTRGAP